MGPKGRLDPMEAWQGPCGHLLLEMLGHRLAAHPGLSLGGSPPPTTWLPVWRLSLLALPCCSTPQTLGTETEGMRGREEGGESGEAGGSEATVWSLWWEQWGAGWTRLE